MSSIRIINASQLLQGQAAVPIGPLLITAVLEDHGYSVQFADYQTYQAERKLSPDTFYNFIQVPERILGISAINGDTPTILGAVRRLKEENPDKIVILGGPGPTDLPTEILEAFPVDIIVVGEGEETIVEVMQALEGEKNLSDIPGIAYRENDHIILNPRRKRIKDLDSFPFAAYHKIDFKDYDYLGATMTIRGCPYKCAFCSVHSVWERKITQRSAENVVEELQLLQEKKIKRLFFYDDTFVLDPKRVVEIVKKMREEAIDIPWSCYGRVNLMTPELFDTMSSNGCVEILYGIESGSNNVLNKINKKFTIEQALKVVEKTAEYFERVETSYIWGYPFETLEDFYVTFMIVFHQIRMPNVTPRIGLLSPLPKSPIYQQYKHLIKFPDDVEIAHCLGFLPGREKLFEYPDVVALAKEHQEIFPSFYYFPHDSFEQKLKIVKTMG
jgi:radical SAM superfamily enzyme YgiQ (UPF0313 family)